MLRLRKWRARITYIDVKWCLRKWQDIAFFFFPMAFFWRNLVIRSDRRTTLCATHNNALCSRIHPIFFPTQSSFPTFPRLIYGRFGVKMGLHAALPNNFLFMAVRNLQKWNIPLGCGYLRPVSIFSRNPHSHRQCHPLTRKPRWTESTPFFIRSSFRFRRRPL